MNFLTRFSSETIALITLGLAVTAVAPLSYFTSSTVVAAPSSDASFPDIENHWARPFIEPLAEKDILAGYLDGTFRPNKPVQRDEFAAVIRQAFDREPVRGISSGSVYKDVPADDWAAPAIAEAYQAGMMTGYPGGVFRPNQNISRVEALVALQKSLNSSPTPPVATATETTTDSTAPQPVTTRQVTNSGGFFILPMMALMQPVVKQPANLTSAPASSSSVATNPSLSASNQPSSTTNNPDLSLKRAASFIVSDSYVDAEKIPHYAVGSVAEATAANIVVNHPNQQTLNPNQPATRGDIAAFIYQTLAAQGKIEPLSPNVEASKYIVKQSTAAMSGSSDQAAQ